MESFSSLHRQAQNRTRSNHYGLNTMFDLKFPEPDSAAVNNARWISIIGDPPKCHQAISRRIPICAAGALQVKREIHSRHAQPRI
jgi:hypothetical protein